VVQLKMKNAMLQDERRALRSLVHTVLSMPIRLESQETNSTMRLSDTFVPGKPIHVVYSCDNRSFPALLVSMLSLARSLDASTDCTIHLIVAESDASSARRLVDCFNQNLSQTDSVWSRQPRKPQVVLHSLVAPRWKVSPHHNHSAPEWTKRLQTPAAFARLYLTEYLPATIPRALWLDTDTIIKNDVTPLFDRVMQHPIAAAYDQKNFQEVYSEFVEAAEVSLHFRINWSERIFNSGVLMVDLDRWRVDDTTQVLERMATSFPGADDQFLLNLVFHQKFDMLEGKWNFIGLGEPLSWWHGITLPSAADIAEARILHFTGRCKPVAVKHRQAKGCISPHDSLYEPYRLRNMCSCQDLVDSPTPRSRHGLCTNVPALTSFRTLSMSTSRAQRRRMQIDRRLDGRMTL
jgi:lipopolysaccharide biosynthesis glycosyltransferase